MTFFAGAILLQLTAILAESVGNRPFYDTSDMVMNDAMIAAWRPGQFNAYDTCDRQSKGVTITVEKLLTPYPECGNFAAFQVCLQFRFPGPRREVSKTCVKNSTLLNPPDFGILMPVPYHPILWANESVGLSLGSDWKLPPDAPNVDYGTQCQIGCSGNYISFEIQDGDRCRPTNLTRWPDAGEVIANTQGFTPADPLKVECHSRIGWAELNVTYGSCTCTHEFQDCVWRVPLPVVPLETSPSPTCCPPMSEECEDAFDKLGEEGYDNEIEIEDCVDPQGVIDALNNLGYQCILSGEPQCQTIKCETLVTKDVLDKLNYITCPV